MKRKLVKSMLSISVAMMMVAGIPASVMAEETAEATEETVDAAEAEDEKIIENVVITVEAEEVILENKTENNYTADYAEVEKEAEEGKEAEKIWVLTLTDEENNAYVFKDVKPQEWKDAALESVFGILVINAKDAADAEVKVEETCEERALEEKITAYTTTDVNVREAAGTDAQVLKISRLGDEYQATAALTGWVKVELEDGKEGYISSAYVTPDQEVIENLKKQAEEAARAQAEAQAQAAQAQAEQSWDDSSYYEEEYVPEEPAVQEVYEVSREAYDDCDGSGHGYYEITYSDGSVAYEDY